MQNQTKFKLDTRLTEYATPALLLTVAKVTKILSIQNSFKQQF